MSADSIHGYAAAFAARLHSPQFGSRAKKTAGRVRGTGQTAPATATAAPKAPTTQSVLPGSETKMSGPAQNAWATRMGGKLASRHSDATTEANDQAHHERVMQRSGEALDRLRGEHKANYSGAAGDLLHTFNARMDEIQAQRHIPSAHDDVAAAFGPRQGASSTTPPSGPVHSQEQFGSRASAAPQPPRPRSSAGGWDGSFPSQKPVDLQQGNKPFAAQGGTTPKAPASKAAATPVARTAKPKSPSAQADPAAPQRSVPVSAPVQPSSKPRMSQPGLFSANTLERSAPAKQAPAPAPSQSAGPRVTQPGLFPKSALQPGHTIPSAPAPTPTATPTASPKAAKRTTPSPAPTAAPNRSARPAASGTLPIHLQHAIDNAHHQLAGKVVAAPAVVHGLKERGLLTSEVRKGASGRVQQYHSLTTEGHSAATPKNKQQFGE
jgi:hypothetical protein